MFVTDCKPQISCDIPDNFHILPMDFNNMVELIKNKLGGWCVCHGPYKLCDYRPAYGLLFSEQIRNYDYWGHCDIDMLFGDLKKYIETPMEDGYNKIFNFGHLTLYKNTKDNNMAFKLNFSGINYKFVFSHNFSFGFDETKGMCLLYEENDISSYTDNYALDVVRPLKIILPFRQPHTGSKKIELYHRKNYTQQIIVWDNGHILHCYIDEGKLRSHEYAYVHFQKREFISNKVVSNEFAILPNSFEDIGGRIDETIFSKFDLEAKFVKMNYKLCSLYRLYAGWYRLTYNHWNSEIE
jgi:hypothetical protein